MSTDSFLSIAETRADHLRQLSQHERALEWVNASLTEVESEIPELELAMAVYRRLNPAAPDMVGSSGQPAFLEIAGVRADHLRQLSHHMRSLDWVTGPLHEIEHEIPELDMAMAVYRRLIPDAADSGSRSSGRGSRSSGARASQEPAQGEGDPPSFREYAMQHLDATGSEDDRTDTNPSASGSNIIF
jgi:hypothetical protein